MSRCFGLLAMIASQLLFPSATKGQVGMSAEAIVAGIVEPEMTDPAALAFMARLANGAPNSASADSVVRGAVHALEHAPGNQIVSSRVLSLLIHFAETGNEYALQKFLLFGETLESPGRRIAVRLAGHLRNEPEIIAFWGRAARDTSAVIANDAIEMLAASGSQGLAELRSLIAEGRIQHSGAQSRAAMFVRWGGVVPPPR